MSSRARRPLFLLLSAVAFGAPALIALSYSRTGSFELPVNVNIFQSAWSSTPRVVTDLLDTELLVRTPGASLLNQLEVEYGPWDMALPAAPVEANVPFTITVQADAAIVGTDAAAAQFQLHFRGPIAYSLAPIEALYHHDAAAGRTTITATVPQAGQYEVWAWPDYARPGYCPPQTPDIPTKVPVMVRGSGATVLRVHAATDARRVQVDRMDACGLDGYEGPGRWVSLAHVREPYRRLAWFKEHAEHSASLQPPTDMPDYVWAPYACKFAPLDYRRLADATGDALHVLYVGDSILRTSFCGSLYTQLHNGTADGVCAYSDNLGAYHYSAKSFTIDVPDAGRGGQARFSQRMIRENVGSGFMTVGDVNTLDPTHPVTHVIMNVGMWFADDNHLNYAGRIEYLLDRAIEHFGRRVRLVWLSTPTVSPGVYCFNKMRRFYLGRQTRIARYVIETYKQRHPDMDIHLVDGWAMTDHRPETASDGRHWTREGNLPNIQHLPLVSRAQDAVMNIIYSRWLHAYEDERAAAATLQLAQQHEVDEAVV